MGGVGHGRRGGGVGRRRRPIRSSSAGSGAQASTAEVGERGEGGARVEGRGAAKGGGGGGAEGGVGEGAEELMRLRWGNRISLCERRGNERE